MTSLGAAALNARQERERCKRDGVFYTPPAVARYMATTTLQASSRRQVSGEPLRVLDPACGDGALLWPAYQFLCHQWGRSQPAERLDIVRRQLFGVDLDHVAVHRLRQRFRDELAMDVPLTELDDVLETNFRCGNAISGHGWESPGSLDDSSSNGAVFHWSRQFPAVSAAGGFDVIIANPPYRRERGAKSDLENLEQSPLATSRRQARMDLWHYFFHRSLDLLRPGGLLTLIVNSYWTTSHAGRPLIERMAAETTPLEFVLLETAPVFEGVGGRHLITRMRKGITPESCRIVRFPPLHEGHALDSGFWERLSDDHASDAAATATTVPVLGHDLSRDALFRDGRLNLNLRGTPPTPSSPGLLSAGRCLGDLFEVRQGIAENPPRVTRAQARTDLELRPGEGVFVLSSEELARLELTPAELELVRPYYQAVEITKSWQVPPAQQWLLYLTRQTVPDISVLPQLQRHLVRFRALLERRREARQGKIAWWHLHWPRESRLFERPRILALQMVRDPRFAYVERPTYVGFSVNLIVDRADLSDNGTTCELSLPALEAILNSKFAADWFDAHAKRRGVNLDITGSTLKRFPLPEVKGSACAELVELARQQRQSPTQTIDKRINHLVDELFAT